MPVRHMRTRAENLPDFAPNASDFSNLHDIILSTELNLAPLAERF